MASRIKQKLAKTIIDTIQPKFCQNKHETLLQHFTLHKNGENKEFSWLVKVNPRGDELDSKAAKHGASELLKYEEVKKVDLVEEYGETSLAVHLDANHFIRDVLDSNPVALNFTPASKKVIVEYSSPNIAKPFHAGHLRSTMIGNYVANIKNKLGHDVFKLNYLGDWGTQFGMIQVGVDENKYSDEDLLKDPIKLLYESYVLGNKLAKNDEAYYKKAMDIFKKLEDGEKDLMKQWQKYRAWTIDELNAVYGRLGVQFHEYAWESSYSRQKAENVLNQLRDNGVLSVDDKGRTVATIKGRVMPLIKSDETTLYLIRDLMAIIDRRVKHEFDEMYYVVENGQAEHFHDLFALSNVINAHGTGKLHHVRFGRIQGMSTRRGKTVFLKDMLDELRERVHERQANTKTTKIQMVDNSVADILGVSSVVVNDLKRSRNRDYNFSWDDMARLSGNTGIFLQYTHCRLCNLQLNSGKTAAAASDPTLLQEPEMIDVVGQIAKYETALLNSDDSTESLILLRYLFDLARAANVAIKALNVKKSDDALAGQRLLAFEKCRLVLEDGLKILGLKPLTKM